MQDTTFTKSEAATAKRIETFDSALPQSFLSDACSCFVIYDYEIFISSVVWCYRWGDFVSHFGVPVAVTSQGEIVLGKLLS